MACSPCDSFASPAASAAVPSSASRRRAKLPRIRLRGGDRSGGGESRYEVHPRPEFPYRVAAALPIHRPDDAALQRDRSPDIAQLSQHVRERIPRVHDLLVVLGTEPLVGDGGGRQQRSCSHEVAVEHAVLSDVEARDREVGIMLRHGVLERLQHEVVQGDRGRLDSRGDRERGQRSTDRQTTPRVPHPFRRRALDRLFDRRTCGRRIAGAQGTIGALQERREPLEFAGEVGRVRNESLGRRRRRRGRKRRRLHRAQLDLAVVPGSDVTDLDPHVSAGLERDRERRRREPVDTGSRCKHRPGRGVRLRSGKAGRSKHRGIALENTDPDRCPRRARSGRQLEFECMPAAMTEDPRDLTRGGRASGSRLDPVCLRALPREERWQLPVTRGLPNRGHLRQENREDRPEQIHGSPPRVPVRAPRRLATIPSPRDAR